jgi:peroxiredoxin
MKHMKGEIYMPQGATETSTLKVGDPAPDFTLPGTGGRTVTLSDYRGKNNVFICFYPLDWTPV